MQRKKTHVQSLIQLNARQQDVTELLSAAATDQWGKVVELLERRIFTDINVCTPDQPGRSLPWYAARRGQWDVFILLLDKFPNLDIDLVCQTEEENGTTPLWWASYHAPYSTLVKMVERYDAFNLNAEPTRGELHGVTVVLNMARRGFWELLKIVYLQCLNANFDAQQLVGPHQGETALCLVISASQEALAALVMMYRGATNFSAALTQHTIVDMAATRRYWWFLDVVWKKCSAPEEMRAYFVKTNLDAFLLHAALDQRWFWVNFLLDNFPNIFVDYVYADDGRTTLWCALFFDQQEVVAKLLNRSTAFKWHAAPVTGEHKNKTVLALLLAKNNWQAIINHFSPQAVFHHTQLTGNGRLLLQTALNCQDGVFQQAVIWYLLIILIGVKARTAISEDIYLTSNSELIVAVKAHYMPVIIEALQPLLQQHLDTFLACIDDLSASIDKNSRAEVKWLLLFIVDFFKKHNNYLEIPDCLAEYSYHFCVERDVENKVKRSGNGFKKPAVKRQDSLDLAATPPSQHDDLNEELTASARSILNR